MAGSTVRRTRARASSVNVALVSDARVRIILQSMDQRIRDLEKQNAQLQTAVEELKR